MKITRRQLRQIIKEELSRALSPPFEDEWFKQYWPKLKSALENELLGPYGPAAGMAPGRIEEEELEPIWKSTFGTQFQEELSMVEDELDDKILSKQSGKQERGYTLNQLSDVVRVLDDRYYFVPPDEHETGSGVSKSKGHRVKGIAAPGAVPTSGKGRRDALKRAEIIRKLRTKLEVNL